MPIEAQRVLYFVWFCFSPHIEEVQIEKGIDAGSEAQDVTVDFFRDFLRRSFRVLTWLLFLLA